MSVLDVIGDDQPIQQGVSWRWNKTQGDTKSVVYKGSAEKLQALFNSYKSFGGGLANYEELQLDAMNGTGTLIASVGGQSAQATQDGDSMFELYANDIARRIENAPYFDSLSTEDKSKVYAVYNRAITLPYDGSSVPAGNSLTGKSLTLYQFLENGIHEYYESQYVLRVTMIVSERSSVRASFSGVNQVTTPPSFSGSNAIIGALPDGEWLKKGPVLRSYGEGKWQLSQEYWWAVKWSSVLYGGSYVPT